MTRSEEILAEHGYKVGDEIIIIDKKCNHFGMRLYILNRVFNKTSGFANQGVDLSLEKGGHVYVGYFFKRFKLFKEKTPEDIFWDVIVNE